MCKRILRIGILLLLVAMLFAGCRNKEEEPEMILPGTGKVVGLAMPTQHSQRWIDDCENMKMQLEALGYTVYDQFAENDVNKQISQIEKFIDQKVDCLVVASVDSYSLGIVLRKAKDAGIPVIAYDRLIMDTDAVSLLPQAAKLSAITQASIMQINFFISDFSLILDSDLFILMVQSYPVHVKSKRQGV